MREPLVVVIDIVVGVIRGRGINARRWRPHAGDRVVDLAHAVGPIAPPGENAAIGQRDARVIPAILVHVVTLAPGGVGSGAGHQRRRAYRRPAPGSQEAAIGKAGQASTEHVVLDVRQISEGVVAWIEDGRVSEGFAGRECSRASGGPGDHAAIGQMRDADGNVRPLDHRAPFASNVTLGPHWKSHEGEGEDKMAEVHITPASGQDRDHSMGGEFGKTQISTRVISTKKVRSMDAVILRS